MSVSTTTHSWYSMSFSQRLQALRKERGLTQKALSEKIGVHTTQVQRYESGDTQPSLAALRKLAIALNVSTDALVFDSDERDPPEDWRLQFEALAQFTDEERQIAKAVIDGLILRHTAGHLSQAS